MSGKARNRPVVPDTASFAGVIGRRLQKIYGKDFNETTVNRIMAMVPVPYGSWPVWDEHDIILITYGNSIVAENGIPLKSLHNFMKDYLSGQISCVHILPFFPYTSDDGFSVSDYMKVNPALGTWHDIQSINSDFCLMVDLVINHVSSAHQWFKNYRENRSPGKDYFIEALAEVDYSMVIRPRSSALFTRFETSEGERAVWTTFSADQIDLNFSNQEVLLEILRVMLFYISMGARFIRLDAIAYLWKSNGTTCLHLEQTHEIVKLLRDVAEIARPGTVIVTETNVPNRENWSYFGNGDEAHMVYQFSLPPLLLYSAYFGNTKYLTSWAKQIPEVANDQTFLNYTASHDGIGVRPLEGLVPGSDVEKLISGMKLFGGLVSMKMNRNGTLSPYEINIAWYDAMKGTTDGPDHYHERRFITSQAIMLSLKGIPAIYIHSLLATPNDLKGVEISGRARSINRSVLQEKEVAAFLSGKTGKSRVFRELMKLIGIRKQYSAFNPHSKQRIFEAEPGVFAFERFDESGGQRILCISNLSKNSIQIALPAIEIKNSGIPKDPEFSDLISDQPVDLHHITLDACQTRWILISVGHIFK